MAGRSEAENKMGRDCERCGSEIPKERIEALPDVTLCINCAEKLTPEKKAEFRYNSNGEGPRHW